MHRQLVEVVTLIPIGFNAIEVTLKEFEDLVGGVGSVGADRCVEVSYVLK
jgi:hypothetical protein